MPRQAVPIALNQKKMAREERQRREKAEERLRTGTDKVKPPKWLTPEGKKEFRRLAKLLLEVDLVTNADVDMLAVLANTIVTYQEADAAIREQGLTVTECTRYGEKEVAHPLLAQRRQLADQIRALAGEFGLTPSARARLAMHLPKEEAKEPTAFEQLFGNVVPMQKRREAK